LAIGKQKMVVMGLQKHIAESENAGMDHLYCQNSALPQFSDVSLDVFSRRIYEGHANITLLASPQ
jgi:hypothetical protein